MGFFRTKNSNKLHCKNFFLFFLIFDFLKNRKYSKKFKISIKKKNLQTISFLRAPYKNKKAQIKLNLVRYRIIFNFEIFYLIKVYNFFTFNFFLYFLNFILDMFFFFESSFFFFERKNLLIKLNKKKINNFFFEL